METPGTMLTDPRRGGEPMGVITEFPGWMEEDSTGRFEMRTTPNPVLREVSERVARHEFGPGLRAFTDRMTSFMHANNGVGLAAPQIGLLKRIFVMKTDFGHRIVINPILLPLCEGGTGPGREGCLSIPGVDAIVVRHNRVSLSYQDAGGKVRRVTLTGLSARIAQHEFDHLNGVLMTDRAVDQYTEIQTRPSEAPTAKRA